MILIFESTTAALNAEARFEEWGLDVESVPVPKSASRQCGLALEIFPHDTELSVKALNVAGLTLVINQKG